MKCSRPLLYLLVFFVLVASHEVLFAAVGLESPLPHDLESTAWGTMLMGLLGGLALFLFGMEQMSGGLKAAAGRRMKDLLAKLTTNRFSAAMTGAGVTAVIQSSSVTTVLVVGFVSAGLMTLSQSIGVILGANVGTTVTAQIVAFKVQKAAMLIIAVGFAMQFLSKNEKVNQYGNIIMGLGLVFFGMSVMSDAMAPLKTYQPFIDLMVKMEYPLLGILTAAAFTALVQSSSATTGIVIAMASQGLLSLTGGIALIFGSNIGTCVTALLASAGKSSEALRVAVVHVLFNVLGVVIWLAFIPQLAVAVTALSPISTDLVGVDKLAAEVPRQIANAHTIFNVANTMFFLLFTTQLARLVERLIPQREAELRVIVKPKYLDEDVIDTPSFALENVRLELGHMADIVKDMYEEIREAFFSRDHEKLDLVAALDDKVDILHDAILDYLNRIMRGELTSENNALVLTYIRTCEDLERIGDVIETDFVDIAHRVLREGLEPSETMMHILGELYEQVRTALHDAIDSTYSGDEVAAQAVINKKTAINFLIDEAVRFQSDRMSKDKSIAVLASRIENEVIDGLKRIYSLSKRLARLTVPEALVQEGG